MGGGRPGYRALGVQVRACRVRLAARRSSRSGVRHPLEAQVLVEDWRIESNTVRPTAPSLPHPDRLCQDLDQPQSHSGSSNRGPAMVVQWLQRPRHRRHWYLEQLMWAEPRAGLRRWVLPAEGGLDAGRKVSQLLNSTDTTERDARMLRLHPRPVCRSTLDSCRVQQGSPCSGYGTLTGSVLPEVSPAGRPGASDRSCGRPPGSGVGHLIGLRLAAARAAAVRWKNGSPPWPR